MYPLDSIQALQDQEQNIRWRYMMTSSYRPYYIKCLMIHSISSHWRHLQIYQLSPQACFNLCHLLLASQRSCRWDLNVSWNQKVENWLTHIWGMFIWSSRIYCVIRGVSNVLWGSRMAKDKTLGKFVSNKHISLPRVVCLLVCHQIGLKTASLVWLSK